MKTDKVTITEDEEKLRKLKEHLDTLYSECETFTQDTEIEVVQYVEQRIDEIKKDIEILKCSVNPNS
ncbi:MAG: hypothetical protein K5752_04445 [Succinivibrionaceae bacterium]|nr:hypothetical protein [Succinivibrionaceae bacterium]